MPKFTYVARDARGERIEGSLEVEDRQAVVSRLQTMGYFPIEIVDTTPKARFGLSLSSLRGKVPASEFVSFSRQLADLVAAGVPLVKALSIILNQTNDAQLQSVVGELLKSVQGGDSLALCFGAMPAPTRVCGPSFSPGGGRFCPCACDVGGSGESVARASTIGLSLASADVVDPSLQPDSYADRICAHRQCDGDRARSLLVYLVCRLGECFGVAWAL